MGSATRSYLPYDEWKKNLMGDMKKLSAAEIFAKSEYLTGDSALAKYAEAPEIIRNVVEAERVEHKKCATDKKPLRVDVERVLASKTTRLTITCGGCGESKQIEIDEVSGATSSLFDTKLAKKIARSIAPAKDAPTLNLPPLGLIRKIYEDVYSSAQPLMFTAAPSYSSNANASLDPKPLCGNPKPPIDRLKIERASPALDEDV